MNIDLHDQYFSVQHEDFNQPPDQPNQPTNKLTDWPTKLHRAVLLEKLTLIHLVKISLPFTEPEHSLPCSQQSPLVLNLRQMHPVHNFPPHFPKIQSNNIFTSMPRFSKWSLSLLPTYRKPVTKIMTQLLHTIILTQDYLDFTLCSTKSFVTEQHITVPNKE